MRRSAVVLSNFFRTISLQARGEMLRGHVPYQNTDQVAVVVSKSRAEAKATTSYVEIAVGSWHAKRTRVTTRRIIKMDLKNILSETMMEQRTLPTKKARTMLWQASRLKWKHWRRLRKTWGRIYQTMKTSPSSRNVTTRPTED